MMIWPPPPAGGENAPAPLPKPPPLRRFWNWLFAPQTGPRTVWTIILWWERRRLVYNLLVGAMGICSFLLFFFFITHAGVLRPGEDAEEPLALIAAPFLINLCYCAGAIVETLLFRLNPEQSRSVGPKLLRAGLYFSLVVVWLPAVFWGAAWLRRAL